MKVREILEGFEGYNPDFKLLDGTNPVKAYSQAEVLAAMKQLHARVHRQAEHYGGKVDTKTGKVDRSKHHFFHAQIAHR